MHIHWWILQRNVEVSWWRHQMETFSALLAICAGISPVAGEFPAQRPVTRGFDVFFGLRLNERLNKQSLGWWFETPSLSLWRHCNGKCSLCAHNGFDYVLSLFTDHASEWCCHDRHILVCLEADRSTQQLIKWLAENTENIYAKDRYKCISQWEWEKSE